MVKASSMRFYLNKNTQSKIRSRQCSLSHRLGFCLTVFMCNGMVI